MVPVVVDLVVVDRQEVAVVVGVEAVPRVVVHLVPPPVSLLVAVRVDPEVVVVYVRIVDVAVDVDIVEHDVVTLVDAKPTDLARWMEGPSVGSRRVEKWRRVLEVWKTLRLACQGVLVRLDRHRLSSSGWNHSTSPSQCSDCLFALYSIAPTTNSSSHACSRVIMPDR